MTNYNYKCVVSKNGGKRYYKNVSGKWKRISNKSGEKAEKGKKKYGMDAETDTERYEAALRLAIEASLGKDTGGSSGEGSSSGGEREEKEKKVLDRALAASERDEGERKERERERERKERKELDRAIAASLEYTESSGGSSGRSGGSSSGRSGGSSGGRSGGSSGGRSGGTSYTPSPLPRDAPNNAVAFVVSKDGYILLLKHNYGGSNVMNKWGPSGGKKDGKDIDHKAAALRELTEETGIPEKLIVNYNESEPWICYGKAVYFFWELNKNHNQINIKLEPLPGMSYPEHTDFKWVKFDDVKNQDNVSYFVNCFHELELIYKRLRSNVLSEKIKMDFRYN